MGKNYFIFGDQACRAYDEGTNALVTAMLSGGGILYEADPEAPNALTDLLTQYDGWDEWLDIDKDEYEEIEEALQYERIGDWTGAELFDWLQENELIAEDEEFDNWLHSRGDMVDMVRDNIDKFYE